MQTNRHTTIDQSALPISKKIRLHITNDSIVGQNCSKNLQIKQEKAEHIEVNSVAINNHGFPNLTQVTNYGEDVHDSGHSCMSHDTVLYSDSKSFTTSSLYECTTSLSKRLAAIEQLRYSNELASKLLHIETLLADELMKLNYGDKISHIYNPVDYAFEPHMQYYSKYCFANAKVLMVGMNPGPFGMAQTGVPFGDVKSVTEWLGITGLVVSPRKVHKKRPITGYDCRRKEVSGTRLWGFLEAEFGLPDQFFKNCFIYNHCPLVYMGPSGKNVTPAQMPAAVKQEVNRLCDKALADSIQLYGNNYHTLVGVGRFAEQRIKHVCAKFNLPHSQGYVMHPSPRNPTANREWNSMAQRSLRELGITVNRTNVKRELFPVTE